jgi:hypothetical protein
MHFSESMIGLQLVYEDGAYSLLVSETLILPPSVSNLNMPRVKTRGHLLFGTAARLCPVRYRKRR